MIVNTIKPGIFCLLLFLAVACSGGGKPKDATSTTTEPSSQAYPPQNPGDEDASDTTRVSPSTSASATPK